MREAGAHTLAQWPRAETIEADRIATERADTPSRPSATHTWVIATRVVVCVFTEEELAGEEWRPVVGFDGFYEVSSGGKIRSIGREAIKANGQHVTYSGKELSLKPRNDGYVMVNLCRDGIVTKRLVHNLVAEAFLDNPSNLPSVKHLNGLRNDNRAENLCWVSLEEVAKRRASGGGRNVIKPYVRESVESLPNEQWADVKGYESLYRVSTCGRVFSIVSSKILKPSCHKKGYLYVSLSKDGIAKSLKVHRLVAEAFLENPNNYPMVNHLDENKANNSVENLEWCDNRYNVNYGTGLQRGAVTRGKPVLQFDLNGNLIRRWNTTREAARFLGVSHNNISCACRRVKYYEHGRACGYKWVYEEDFYDKAS